MSVELVPLEKLLAESDCVLLHTALSPATENLINAATIEKMKKGARLVNAARGELIDAEALAEALKSGALAGDGRGAFAGEAPEKCPLARLADRARGRPRAGATEGAEEERRTP